MSGCSSEPAPRRVDGGAFVLPDGGFRDASVRDAGFDAGKDPCMERCAPNEACGCLELPAARSCGCHPRGGHADVCDPNNPRTCQDELRCVAGRNGQTIYFCSDGRAESLCSKRNDPDVCRTTLGCVCLTLPSGLTTCRCADTPDPDNPLCDPDVPETCTSGTCVQASAPGGITYFVCSDGREGQPCAPDDSSCQTTLGCTCPLVAGLQRCRCSEPSVEGGPCDVDVPESCVDGLSCVPERTVDGTRTICTSAVPDAGTASDIPCDPGDPFSCPAGFICLPGPNGFRCAPQ